VDVGASASVNRLFLGGGGGGMDPPSWELLNWLFREEDLLHFNEREIPATVTVPASVSKQDTASAWEEKSKKQKEEDDGGWRTLTHW
jgi:hypothetical protein